MSTSDYNTALKLAANLTNEDVLVGECDGLSAVFSVTESDAMPGMVNVETEHGPLYLNPDHEYTVLAPIEGS